jgi:hypothetical protein
VAQLKADGLSNRAIAQRIGVSENAVRKLLRRLGWRPATGEQERLPLASPAAHPNLSAFSAAPPASPPFAARDEPPAGADPNVSGLGVLEDVPMSLDRDPADRRLDRLLAYLGLIDDAAPLFRSAERIPRVGVLLALPPFVTSGVFTVAREVCGSLGPAFYGLRTTMVALLLLALLRIKRPEALKEHAPDEAPACTAHPRATQAA